jgi:hypothetical protein
MKPTWCYVVGRVLKALSLREKSLLIESSVPPLDMVDGQCVLHGVEGLQDSFRSSRSKTYVGSVSLCTTNHNQTDIGQNIDIFLFLP